MMACGSARVLLVILVISLLVSLTDSRMSARRNKGKGTPHLTQKNVVTFSMLQTTPADNRSAYIIKGSYFSQIFRLGHKIHLMCLAGGEPRPTIYWQKNADNLPRKPQIHVSWREYPNDVMLSRLVIDPATMGDAAIYQCIATNKYGAVSKNFRVDFSMQRGVEM